MIITPDATIIGGTSLPGISVPGAIVIGRKGKAPAPPNYIFIQNDSYTNPASAWYISKVDDAHYEMTHATSPKWSMYIGAFVYDTAKDKLVSRLDGTAVWNASDATVARVDSVSSTGQAIVSIVKAGTATLTVEWGGMTSTLTITST